MVIHLVTDRFHTGGGLEHIYQVARGLGDIRFRIFARPGEREAVEKFKELENVTIRDGGYDPAYVLAEGPDLVHIHHLKPFFSFFNRPFRRYGVPVMYTAHGLHIHKFEFYGSMGGRLRYFLRFHLEKRLLPKASRVVAVSCEDKVFLEERYGLGNVTYLTNGIDFSAVTGGVERVEGRTREELGLPGDAFLFVTVARFNFQKGYDILLRAISRVRDGLRGRKCCFVFVGDGEEFEEMKELARELSVSEFVLFLGMRTDVYDILRVGDVFLLPSRWEGLPIVLLEAGLLGLPVIASDTYGNREIIGDRNGILFKNLDVEVLAGVIVDVLDGKHDLAACSANLYNEVQSNYSLDKMLSGLRELYQSVSI